jgi:hypothetical protein
MSLLGRLIQYLQKFLQKKDHTEQPRVFLKDENLSCYQRHSKATKPGYEEMADFTKAGLNQL